MRKSKTKKELHEAKKKELNEELEYLRQVDNPESQGGGRKYVHDKRLEEKAKDKEDEDRNANWLESKIGTRFTYREGLADFGQRRLIQQDFPPHWEYYCIPTDGARPVIIYSKSFKSQEGVLFIVKSPKGNVYVRGIKTTYNVDMDMNAVNVMVTQVENTIDSERGLLLSDNKDTAASLKKTSSGIYIP